MKLDQKAHFMKRITADFILGFTEGKGCFSLDIVKKKKTTIGFYFTPSFSISVNAESMKLLKQIKTFFKCGSIRNDRKSVKYEVCDLDNLEKRIIPFFKKNQLRSQKKQDFQTFCEICEVLKRKHHLTFSGVQILISLAYSLNKTSLNHRKKKSTVLFEYVDQMNSYFEELKKNQ